MKSSFQTVMQCNAELNKIMKIIFPKYDDVCVATQGKLYFLAPYYFILWCLFLPNTTMAWWSNTTVHIFVFVTNRPVQHCTNHNVAKYTDLICSSVLCCIDYALIILAKPSPYILKPGVIGVETLQIIYWTKKQVQNVCILCRSNTNKNTNTHTHKGASSY